MDPIRALQARAAEKRDATIAEARRQYRKDIAAIDAMEKLLPAPRVIDKRQPLGKVPAVYDLVRQAVRPDTPFTVTDMLAWLAEAHPGAKFHEQSVRSYTSRLCSQGFLRRLYKTGHMETMYIKAESVVSEGPVESKPLAEMTHEILTAAGRPMTVTELIIAMREQGYRKEALPNTLRRAVRDMFKRYPGRFARGKDGAWEIA